MDTMTKTMPIKNKWRENNMEAVKIYQSNYHKTYKRDPVKRSEKNAIYYQTAKAKRALAALNALHENTIL